MSWAPLTDVDAGARDGLHRFAVEHDWFVTAMKGVSLLGSSWVYLPALAALVAWLALGAGRPRAAAFLVVTVIGSGLLNRAVKELVQRARPVLDDPVARAGGASFPSGHAQAAVVVYGALLLLALPLLRRRGRGARTAALVAFGALVVLIGFSRVALGVHYVSDVLGGYVVGAAWLALTATAFAVGRVRSPG